MNGTIYNSVIEYHCVPGYTRVGAFLRKCMENSEWSGEEPKCERKYGILKLIFNNRKYPIKEHKWSKTQQNLTDIYRLKELIQNLLRGTQNFVHRYIC